MSASRDHNASAKQTNLPMAGGRARVYAIHLFSDKGTTMTVESPTTVVEVRGTKCGREND